MKTAIYNLFLVTIIVTTFQSGGAGNSLAATSTSNTSQASLNIISVKSETTPASRLLIGGTVAAQKSVLLSAQLPGRIVSIAGEEGDNFKPGIVLVKINDDELLAARHTALMQLANAQSVVQNANIQLSRQIISPSTSNKAPGGMGLPGMFDQIFTNPFSEMMGTRDYAVERHADIMAIRSQLEQAYFAVQQAQAKIRQIDSKLRDTQSIAPFAGTIVKKAVEIGDTVQPGQTLLVYEDLTRLEIIADVPNRLVPHLQTGQAVNIRIDGLSQRLNAQINKIFPTSDPIRHTTRIKFIFPSRANLSPGNYAEIEIPTTQQSDTQRLLVPASAIIKRGGLPAVLVVNQQQRVELHLVRLGDFLPSGEVVVLYGVKEQQRIIDKPPAYLTSGYQIQ